MTLTKLLDYLPRGNLLDDETWHKRHKFLLWILGLHVPAITFFGLWLGYSPSLVLTVVAVPAVLDLIASLVRHRRTASVLVTAGLTSCSVAIVTLSHGSIEAHFHFFIIVGFIALYQDWVPFLWNIVFTTISHGVGSIFRPDLIFNHLAGQHNPWLWSVIHGASVLLACFGVVVFWRETEDQQQKTLALSTKLANAELDQRKFTSDLLVNLARRNQSMLYRQLDIIGQLEEKERDPDALAELFRLDHLATRIRRNAESLLVLSGEEPTRIWREPVRLIDVVRAAIAETEDLDRVSFAVDERMEVLGHLVTDLTHMLAELTENAVRFSPPEANVTIRTRPYMRNPGAAVLTVEDWGVGMRPEDMAAANDVLANPRDVDLSVSQRLGLHVVARLATRHHIEVSLTATPGCGITAAVVLPRELFAETQPTDPGPSSSGARAMPAGNGSAAVAGPPHAPAPDGPGRSVGPAQHPDIPTPRQAPPPARVGHPLWVSGPTLPPPYETHPPRPVRGMPQAGTTSPTGPARSRSERLGTGPGRRQPADAGRHAHGTAGSAGARSGQRGVHATPPGTPAENPGDWTGWWTPVRLPTVDAESWEEVEPAQAAPSAPSAPSARNEHQGWTPPPPLAAALPAGPSDRRERDASTGPVITAREERANGTGNGAGNDRASNAGNGNGDDPSPGSSREVPGRSPRPSGPGPAGAREPRLTRRVPKASMARELRRDSADSADSAGPDAVIPQPAPPPDAEQTRSALSRFQASRQAARDQVENTERDHGDRGRDEAAQTGPDDETDNPGRANGWRTT